MSISEQVMELRKYCIELDKYGGDFNNQLSCEINNAIDTIESLYAKLQAENMERSAEECGCGWIPCKDRLPEGENQKVIVSAIWDGYEYTTQSYFYHGKFYNKPYYQIPAVEIQESYTGDMVVAWQPLPIPYHEP